MRCGFGFHKWVTEWQGSWDEFFTPNSHIVHGARWPLTDVPDGPYQEGKEVRGVTIERCGRCGLLQRNFQYGSYQSHKQHAIEEQLRRLQ